jgi:hypothetical protein
MRAPGVKAPEDLDQAQLIELVSIVQEVLWLDRGTESNWQLNPDKEWDVDMLDRIAEAFERCGLRPERLVDVLQEKT